MDLDVRNRTTVLLLEKWVNLGFFYGFFTLLTVTCGLQKVARVARPKQRKVAARHVYSLAQGTLA